MPPSVWHTAQLAAKSACPASMPAEALPLSLRQRILGNSASFFAVRARFSTKGIWLAYMLTHAAADGGESAGPGLRGTLRAIPAFLIPAGTLVPLLLRYGVTGFDRPKALAPAALGAGLLGPYTLAFELISVVLLAAMAGAVMLAFEKRGAK